MKRTNRILLAITAALILCVAGCSTTQRETKNKDGTTTKSKQSSLFIQVQGFDDSIDADGAQHTSIANFATDAQGIMAMDNLLNNFMRNMAMFVALNNGTNGPATNVLAVLMRQQQDQPKQATSSRHLYRLPK